MKFAWLSMSNLPSLPSRQTNRKTQNKSLCRNGKDIAALSFAEFRRIKHNIKKFSFLLLLMITVCRHGKQIAKRRFKEFAVTAKLSQVWLLHHRYRNNKEIEFCI